MTVSLGSLDHMHLLVPDREAAAQWYEQTLGFRRIDAFEFWAEQPGGPLHLSADDGDSGIALFQASADQELVGIGRGIAFKQGAAAFIEFAKALEQELQLLDLQGRPLRLASIVDLDLCYSFNFQDPFGHAIELNCYDYTDVKQALILPEAIRPLRYW